MVQQRQLPPRHLVSAPAVLFQITWSIAVRTVPAHTDIRSELAVDLVPRRRPRELTPTPAPWLFARPSITKNSIQTIRFSMMGRSSTMTISCLMGNDSAPMHNKATGLSHCNRDRPLSAFSGWVYGVAVLWVRKRCSGVRERRQCCRREQQRRKKRLHEFLSSSVNGQPITATRNARAQPQGCQMALDEKEPGRSFNAAGQEGSATGRWWERNSETSGADEIHRRQ
jgi:hypothetical protein